MQKNDQITFFHVATNTQDLKHFFHEGAQSVSPNQSGGFYVWSNEEDADNHIRLLDGGFLNKTLHNHEALVLGIHLSKTDLNYPTWQLDVECAPGLLELLRQNARTINEKLNNLNIDLPQNDSFLKKVSAISCQPRDGLTEFTFKGKTPVNTDLPYSLVCYENSNPCSKASDAVFLQSLVDSLCIHSPEFKEEYNQLIQHMAQLHCAFKYTGKDTLPVSLIKHVHIDKDGDLKKTILFDDKKGSNQVCPFFKIKNLQR